MTVLIAGGAGFVGSHLSELLISEGKNVVVLDNFNDYYAPKQKENNVQSLLKNKNFVLVKGDIRDKVLVEKVFTKHKIEKVVHLAAVAGVRYSVENPEYCYDVNLNGTLNLLEASRKNKIKQFVFASSSSVYGQPERFPTKETDNTDKQLSPYATSKKCNEMMCKNYNKIYGLPITCLRFFTVYGPRNRPDMAVYKFAKAIKEQKPLPMFGDGNSKRDYTFVKDIAQGINKALNKNLGFEIINLGNHNPTKLKELIQELEKNLGKKAIIERKPWPASDPLVTYANISKAKKLLTWQPKTGIQKGIKEFSEWYINTD